MLLREVKNGQTKAAILYKTQTEYENYFEAIKLGGLNF